MIYVASDQKAKSLQWIMYIEGLKILFLQCVSAMSIHITLQFSLKKILRCLFFKKLLNLLNETWKKVQSFWLFFQNHTKRLVAFCRLT